MLHVVKDLLILMYAPSRNRKALKTVVFKAFLGFILRGPLFYFDNDIKK